MSNPVPAESAPFGRLHIWARRLRSSRGRSAQAKAWSALPSGQVPLPPPPPPGGERPLNSAASHARRSPNSQASCIPSACWLVLAFGSHPWRADGVGVWASQPPRCLQGPVNQVRGEKCTIGNRSSHSGWPAAFSGLRGTVLPAKKVRLQSNFSAQPSTHPYKACTAHICAAVQSPKACCSRLSHGSACARVCSLLESPEDEAFGSLRLAPERGLALLAFGHI
jgi:hypothetical protein